MTDTTTKMTEEITNGTYAAMMADCDVSHASGAIARHMRRLADACDIAPRKAGERDEYTASLVDAYIGFVAAPANDIYGSNADYCASNAMTGVGGYRLRLRETAEADEILHEIRVGIHATALEPRRSFWVLSKAGVPISRKKFLAKK